MPMPTGWSGATRPPFADWRHNCKGLPLPIGAVCEPCGQTQAESNRAIRSLTEDGRAEVEAAWIQWRARRLELDRENDRAVKDIMGGPVDEGPSETPLRARKRKEREQSRDD